MKLFSNEEVKLQFTLEEFVEYHQNAKLVSTEAISDFFHGLVDVFDNTTDRLFSSDLTKEAIDATSDKNKVNHILNRVHLHHLSEEVVTTPENFKGNLSELATELSRASEESLELTVKVLEDLKMAIAGFINEYKENNVLTIYGYANGKKVGARISDMNKKVAKFYPLKNGKSKARIVDVIHNTTDIKDLFNEVHVLTTNINRTKLEKINKLSKDVAELVDGLIEVNMGSNILNKNTNAKKDLVAFMEVGSRCVEFCGYLYGNAITLMNSVKSVSDAVVRVGGRVG